jgi:2-polyprenyl-3-methyl-5-hydroxy-6-metoxy-1,4-benzoquinol methylase
MVNSYKKKYSGVADLYDVYVDAGFDIPFWINESMKDGEVLELTSGTGRVTVPLARSGVKVTAVDISKDLLNILRKKVTRERLDIEIHEADMRQFNLRKKFPLIIIPFNSIQEIIDPEDHRAVFLRVKGHLKPGGRFFVTSNNVDLRHGDVPKSPVREYTNPENGHKVQYWISYQNYREYDDNGNFVGRRLFKNRYYVFRKSELERLTKSTGFRVKNLYGDYSRGKFTKRSPFMIYELVAKV